MSGKLLFSVFLLAIFATKGAIGEDSPDAIQTFEGAPPSKQAAPNNVTASSSSNTFNFNEGLLEELKNLYMEKQKNKVKYLTAISFLGELGLYNFTDMESKLSEEIKNEVKLVAKFFSENMCYFPLNGKTNVNERRWRDFLSMRAGLTGNLKGDVNYVDEVDMIPWAQFPIICTNSTFEIPKWVGKFQWMNKLITSFSTPIYVNSVGDFPAGMVNLTQLTTIQLQGSLTGTLPRDLGKLSELRSLLLQRNELTGTIPSSIGMCEKLQKIWLNNNRLSGTIPATLTNLTNLEELMLYDNNLVGTLTSDVLTLQTRLGQNFQIQGNPIWKTITGTHEDHTLGGWEIAVVVLASCLAATTLVVTFTWALRRQGRLRTRSPKQSCELESIHSSSFEESSMMDFDLFCINKKELKLIKLIGRGTYGTVYKAEWTNKEWGMHDVAVKIMNIVDHTVSREESRRIIKTFEQEVDCLSKILHKNIVKLYGYSLAMPHVYIVQELMTHSLHEVVHAEDYLPNYENILKIIQDIANGLAYLHPRIVHCDLKPQNILLNGEGDAKIADFGISKSKQGTFIQFTRHNHVPGSVIYMAPECFNAPEQIGEKCDVFSLGMIMWECWAGEEPWDALPTPISVVNAVAVQGRRPQIPASCPEPFQRLIRKCWQTDYEKRPSCAEVAKTCKLMLEDLNKVDDSRSRIHSTI